LHLQLDGWPDVRRFQKIPVIHGDIIDGTNVTLFDCFHGGISTGSSGLVEVHYTPMLCIFGVYFRQRKDVKFYTVRFRLTGMEAWIGVHPFDVNDFRTLPIKPDPQVRVTPPKAITIDVPRRRLSMKISPYIRPNEHAFTSVTVEHSSVIDLTPTKLILLKDATDFIEDCRKLFTLLIAKPVSVVSVAGGVKAAYRKPGNRKAEPDKKNVPCTIIYPQTNQRANKDFEHGMMLPLRFTDDRFPQMFLKWFELLKTLRPVFDVFFGVFKTDVPLELWFLSLSQVVESYHRRSVGGLYMNRRSFDKIEKVTVSAIPATVQEGLRSRMKNQIHYANEPSLRTRLTKILEGLSDTERQIICQNVGEFVAAVVGTRNYLTHLDEESDDPILRDVPLYQAATRLELLMFIIFLKCLGIEAAKVLKVIKACHRFDLSPFKLQSEDELYAKSHA
jgi:hypothetical protein